MLKVLSVFAFLVLCALFFLLDRQLNQMSRSTELLSQTNTVRTQLSQTLAKMKDAEARQRGFLLTSNPTFLDREEYRQAQLMLDIQQLRFLVKDNPVQLQHIDTLAALITRRLELLDTVKAYYRPQAPEHEKAKTGLMEGRRLTTAIENRFRYVDSLQTALLKQHEADNNRFVSATPRLAGAMIVAALFILFWAFFRQRRLLQLSETYLNSSFLSEAETRRTSLLLEQAEALSKSGSWEWNYTQNAVVLSANTYRLLHLQGSGHLPMERVLAGLTESDRQFFLRTIASHIALGQELFSTRFWFQCASNQPKYFQCKGRIGRNAKGEVVITGTVHDMTEEESLRQQLQQRKDLIESIVENSSDLIAVIDTDMCYTVWNKANELQFGRSKQEVLGRHITDVFPFLREDRRLKYIREGLQGKAAYLKELPYLNGQKTAEFSYVPLNNPQGNVIGLLIMAHDITERKRAAEDLQRANVALQQKNTDLEQASAYNRLISDLAPNNIVVFDAVRQVPVFLNKQARATFGLDPEELNGLQNSLTQQVIHPDDFPAEAQKLKQMLTAADTDIVESDCRLKNRNGQYRQMHIWRAVFKRNAAGQVEQIISISIDVTDLRKAERELREKNRELQQANEELSSFNYIASHDLQEPLRKVQIFANVLEENEKSLTPQGRVCLQKIQESAIRMRNLISDLLSFSQVSMREETAQPVDLNAVMRDTTTTFKSLADEKGANITAEPLPVVKGMDYQLRQLFENIVGNALKYSKPGVPPLIRVSADCVTVGDTNGNGLERGRRYHRLRFADNGIGFKPELGTKIFELFERLPQKQEIAGTGIGLAICRKVVQNHRGHISANGSPGEGAVIDVYLPASIN